MIVDDSATIQRSIVHVVGMSGPDARATRSENDLGGATSEIAGMVREAVKSRVQEQTATVQANIGGEHDAESSFLYHQSDE